MSVALDHLLWGAPDLEDASAKFEALTGVAPATGGNHPGFGTRNRLVSLHGGVFFEIISPDPEQTLSPGSRGSIIAAMKTPGLLTFAIRTDDLDAVCAAAAAAGLRVLSRYPMTRTRPDGVTLRWTIARFDHRGYGDLIPFAIDWQGSPHPADTTPAGCTLHAFTALHPDPAPLEAIYRAIGIDVPVQGAPKPGFTAVLGTPHGDVTLRSA
jgi:hypothetical protein